MADLIRELNDLIELDFDAIEAYEAAVNRLRNDEWKTRLRAFRDDHRRHVDNLTMRVRTLGGEPATGPDAMSLLTQGKVVIGNILGGDHAILLAMRANEEVTNKRYEAALASDELDADTRGIVEANLADERRHRAWLEDRLDAADAAEA